MKQAFAAITIILILTGCGEKATPDPSGEKESSSLKSEKTIIVNRLTGDTIPTGVPLAFNKEGVIKANATKVLKSEGAEIKTDTFSLFSNTGAAYVEHVSPFFLDSAELLSPEDTAIDPPKELKLVPEIITAKEPKRRKVLPGRYKDNTQYDIRTFGMDEGLPSNNVLDVVKDSRGYMWIATDKGLSKYDGKFITTYTQESGLSDRYITCLDLDRNQNLWMGTRAKGIIKFDGNKFYNYNLDSLGVGRKLNDITVDHKNQIWGAIEFGGFFKIENEETCYAYQADQGIYTSRPTTSVAVDKDNNKWITGFGVGLYFVDNDDNVFKQSKAFYPQSTYITNCLIDQKGNPLLSLWRSRFVYCSGDSSYQYTVKDVPGCPLFIDTDQDEEGGLWLAGYGSGVYHWDQETNQIEFYGTDQGVSSEYISAICTENNSVWIGTEGGGLCHYQRNSFKSVNEHNGLEDQFVYEVIEHSSGDMYYATADYLLKQDSSGFTRYLRRGNNLADCMVMPDGTIWLPTMNSGPSRIRNGKFIRFGAHHGAPHNPTCMDTTSDGHVWFAGMNASLIRIEDTALFQYSYENGLHVLNHNDMYITDDDEIWLGSSEEGVVNIKDDSITYWTTNEGLASNIINHITEDNSKRIWICTEEGLHFMEESKLIQVTNNSPVFSRNFMGIIQDSENRYWIPTDEGLIALVPKVTAQETWKLEDFTIHQIDKKNGLNNVNFLANSIFIDSKNRLMMGTKGGLAVLDLNKVSFDRTIPSTYLNSIGINGKEIDYRNDDNLGFEVGELSSFGNYPKSLELPHDLNHVTFEFSGINWNDPYELTVLYYLEGYEQDWNESRGDYIADYRNLSYGDYTFHLKSMTRDGLESDEVTYSLVIQRPWWHTWWARIMYVLILAGSVYIIIRRRTAALKLRQEELESQVARATIKITAQKEQAERQKSTIEKAHSELEIKNQEVIDSINYAKRIQSAILPSEKLVEDRLPNSFIIYKPKDIVAGDFYWMEPSNGSLYFAAADCTGHGVPGAMVSVICNNALNRSVRLHKLEDPAEILNMTRQIVLEEFGQSEEGVNDGMDIALCKLTPTADKKQYSIEFAGAHNPLWVLRKDDSSEEGYRLEEIKGDKQPIGKFHDPKPFKKHEVTVNKGECFYIFTDGFSDQFGGEKGKKFKTANFKRLIVSVQGKSIKKQGELILNMFENWKSDFEQLDDVCVIGVEV